MSHQCQNWDWVLLDAKGKIQTWEQAQVAVLMDIRAELQSLNTMLRCPRFQHIPTTLARIDRRVAKRIRLTQGER